MRALESQEHKEVSPVSYFRASIARILGQCPPHFRYSMAERLLRIAHRKIDPVPTSPWTMGEVEDISKIHLVPPEKLKEFFGDCIDLLKELKGDDIGDYLEFGVFNGSSMGSMVITSENKRNDSTRFFGFDAFQGLPSDSENEDDGVWKKGYYECSFEDMQESLRKRGVNPDEITWVKGWYNETLTPETAQAHQLDNVGIAFIDCDTYSSSKSVLDFLAPLITKPIIVCFDDWKLNDLDVKGMGEYKSFNEFLESNSHLQAREIKSYNRKSKTFLVTPR